MNIAEVSNFVHHWERKLDMSHSRAGILYGYYVEDRHYRKGMRAVVEGIYEPPQQSGPEGEVQFLPDSFSTQLAAVTARLKLERVGWIFTHLPREMALTASEVQQIARFQNESTDQRHYTRYPTSRFVTCTVSPCEGAQGDPTPNAFMVSDMGQSVLKAGLLLPSKDRGDHFDLRPATKREALPTILEASKPTTGVDAHWFVVRVNESAPKTVRSMFEYAVFPRENRGVSISWDHVKKHLSSTPKSQRLQRRMADFHLLLYLAKEFDLDSVLELCDAVTNDTDISTDLRDILESLSL